MVASAYLTATTPARLRETVTSLQRGIFVPSQKVDVHLERLCNLACGFCVGNEEKTAFPLETRVNPSNIGFVLGQILHGHDDPPSIHFAGFTGDPFVDVHLRKNSITGYSSTATEAIIYLIQRGWEYAEKASVVTNGVGLASQIPGLPAEKVHPFIELLSYIGSVQISLDASNSAQYKKVKGRDLFAHVIGNIGALANERFANGKDRNGFFKHLGIESSSVPEFPPMELVVNYVLTDDNCDIPEKFIVKLCSLGVDELRFRVDLFRGKDLSFQKRMAEMVGGFQEDFMDLGMNIVMKSPDKPIDTDSFDTCLAPLFWPAVWDGNIYACAHNVKPGQEIGSLWERPLVDIQREYHEKLIAGDIGSPSCSFLCPSSAGNFNLAYAGK